jgi:hypothetical protein
LRSVVPAYTGIVFAAFSLLATSPKSSSAAITIQEPSANAAKKVPDTLQRDQGTTEIDTPDFRLTLVKAYQTVAALRIKNGDDFDFTPADRLEKRSGDGFYHLGDLTLRVRSASTGFWQEYSTAKMRKPVIPLPTKEGLLASADLSPTLPADCPLQISRSWSVQRGRLTLRFELKNKTTQTLEIGALGIPMVFNNIITDRNLEQAHAVCSFSDPYIGQDAGYLQVTRLSGQGPALIVVPEGKTPFEAYRLLDEPMRPSQTFEGMFAWMVHSRAYAENEWKSATPWNPPTAATLAPGETRTYGVRFLVSDSIRNIEKTLAANGRPVAVGLPGYVLPMDQDGHLFLKYAQNVKAITVEPAGAITVQKEKETKGGWKSYQLHGKKWGRARLTITYEDGLTQAVSYNIIKPAAETVSNLGHFLTTRQWFDDPKDPFHRSPSVISYDREVDKQVTQDSRVWIAGLGDEGGSGSWLAAAMKEFGKPDVAEVARYEQFIDKVLWGGLQYKEGSNKFGVRKSLFFYEPSLVPGFAYDSTRNWTSWTSWNQKSSEDMGRGYNYPHVVAAYWSLYQIARNHTGLVKNHPWDWYLNQAYETTKFLFSRNSKGERRVGWVELGLMEGDIFRLLLQDLQREGWTEKAAEIESLMKERADRWKGEQYPFGSEMAWDSTGQEEVYAWCKYFGYDDKSLVSLNSILGYMPTLPHWGYNGNARRYWDFLYGGKISRIERQLHHYGSGLNAIPVLAEYRDHPDDYYLLRVGYGGVMGALTNIDQEGFASVAFHSFPSTLKWDAYSGDYGPNFFGHAVNTATYIIDHPEFGWQAFGGNVNVQGDWIQIQPRDSFRRRVYLAPRGLWLTLDAGTFQQVSINKRTQAVRIELAPASPTTPTALLRIEQPAKITNTGTYHPQQNFSQERGGYIVLLGKSVTRLDLVEGPSR